MRKQRVLIVFGTRPEAIKFAPVVHALKKRSDVFDTRVCVTGQHREMLDQVLQFFSIQPDFDLNLMQDNQKLGDLTARVLKGVQTVLRVFKADTVLVQGDTTTTFAASLAAFYAGIAVGHVEAGLRTYNKQAPWPEEVNRRLTSVIADIHFAPTRKAFEHLLKDQVPSENIHITGNTGIDALFMALETIQNNKNLQSELATTYQGFDPEKKLILVTEHRRENFGDRLAEICQAILELSKQPNLQFLIPVHPNPHVQDVVFSLLKNKRPNIILTEPLRYPSFVYLMNRADLIITDSGGIQEEVPSLGKPVLVTREVTERPEGLQTGLIHLVGHDAKRIINTSLECLSKDAQQNRSKRLVNPYGDGKAAKRIVRVLERCFFYPRVDLSPQPR